ncbi:unnamed protein product [Parnassius mnemosyne]|uniref:Peptidase M16 N-terminal domain-containing protein n=1 Tax=Parnassius mnemosyne TaxID=213953 RepID=A0AAV1KE78_9NEOP
MDKLLKTMNLINQCLGVRYLSTSINNLTKYLTNPVYGSLEVQRTEMLNGIKVAAAKRLGAQITACTIMFQAGSRYEQDNNLGATHFIRAMSASSGCAYTGYGKMRLLHQRGAFLTCTSDRQSMAFTLRCTIDDFPELKYYLLDTAVRCCFHEWEVTDIKPFIKDNLLRIHPEQRVLDLLQRAFWAGPLGNSVFCEESRVDGMLGTYLKDFVKNFRSDRCSVTSVGLPYEETLKLAETIEFIQDKSCARQIGASFPRAGFEYYDLGRDSDVWIALAVPGCGAYDMSSLFKHSIVAAACGVGHAQVGQHRLDHIAQAPLGLLTKDIYTEFRAFNISYMECGIFGILAKTRACSAGQVARLAAKFLSNVKELNPQQIEVGKRRLKLNIAIQEEDCVKASESLALQEANNIQIDGLHSSFRIIDSISTDEILETARAISSKKKGMAIAVVGDIAAVPHDRELLEDI